MESCTAVKLAKAIIPDLAHQWKGKECIHRLKAETNQWRQSEWPGFYFEHMARTILLNKLGGSVGPTYGNVEFDYECGTVWDFKAHSTNTSPNAILNDVEAVDACVKNRGRIGWAIACGEAIWDTDGEFKDWHNQLKGKESKYSKDRKQRGAPSRRRKAAFVLQEIQTIELHSTDEINTALNDGWLSDGMQRGMRNSNGKPRRSKYSMDFSKLPGSTADQKGRWVIFNI